MKDDIRKKTVIIIRKNEQYLVGRILFSRELRWSESPYDAWWTRDKEKAEECARQVGGITMLWNPIVKQMKVL